MSHDESSEAPLSVLLFTLIAILASTTGALAQGSYKTLHKFTGSDGGSPWAGLTRDAAGNLYGTTTFGGGAGLGTVFKLTSKANGRWAESVLWGFAGGDGATPYAGLIFDSAGNLYGTTAQGGASAGGTVFKLVNNGDGHWTESVLYSFCSITNCADGAFPTSNLVVDRAGNLYGVTTAGGNSYCGYSVGCGTVFKLTANADGSWTESVLYSFCSITNCSQGFRASSGLVFDADGNLYGTTASGGDLECNAPYGCGVVFKLTQNVEGRWKESVLHKFTGADGSNPASLLVFDQERNLYGTTETGGSGNRSQCGGSGCGVVFQLTPNADGRWEEKVLHDFSGAADGGTPDAGVIFDQSGNLYGTTSLGGNVNTCNADFGCGVVFKLAPNLKGGWSETVLHDFAGNPGAGPLAGVISDTAGNLYGTTVGKGNGSVFEITP